MSEKKYKNLFKSYLCCQLDPKYYCLFICVRNISFNFQYKFLPTTLIFRAGEEFKNEKSIRRIHLVRWC